MAKSWSGALSVIDHEGLTMAVVYDDDQLFFALTSDRVVIPDLVDPVS